jgi:hypothetical protein
MRTLHIDPQGARTLNVEIRAGTARFAGTQDIQDITITYGYFVGESEVLDEGSMVPELTINNSTVILRQTQGQAAKASSIGANLRTCITLPVAFSISGQLEYGIFNANNARDCALNMRAGTAQVRDCDGAVRLIIESGTLEVAGIRHGHVHQLVVRSGTITLYAEELLALVTATVEQGMIQGTILGVLEPIGFTGWRLHPTQHEPGTGVECKVGSGTIMCVTSVSRQ